MLISPSYSFPQRHPLPGRARCGKQETGASLVTILLSPHTLQEQLPRDMGAGSYPGSPASLCAGKPGALPTLTC